MLTEKAAADPRRANWLTITSMAEDIWPEDGGTRPSWELEAEILRLTARLMMRERELRQVKSQLKAQTSRSQQQMNAWRRKLDEKDEQMKILRVQKDAEMQSIVSQLLLFEAELRKEQSRIERLLGERDSQIKKQQEELDELRQRLSLTQAGILDTTAEGNAKVSSVSNTAAVARVDTAKTARQNYTDDNSSVAVVKKLRNEIIRQRAIQDLTNVRTAPEGKTFVVEASSENVLSTEKKRATYSRTPQRMKDLKAKRVNQHKGIHRSLITEVCNQVIL